jgi:Tol biopolymer transport system component
MRATLQGAFLSLFILLSVTPVAQAQYFGRNKVQYKDFKFEVLKTEHFDIYFYQDEREAAERVGRMAERWYARHAQVFNHQMKTRQPLVLYASHPDFEQTNVIGGSIDEGTGGVTEGMKRRVVLPMAGTLAETDHVLGHELVHAFQYDIAAQRASGQNGGGGAGVENLPLWFIEGMAEYLSLGPVDPHTAMWLRDAARKEKLPAISDLDNPKYFPYRWGQALWAFIGGRWGDDKVAQIYRDALRSGDLEVALKNATGLKTKELSDEWHTAIHDQYDPILKANARVGTFGKSVTEADKTELAMNVSPSLSPDGTKIIYFSSRDMLSIGLFLADAPNGQIIRKLVDTTLDPHFSSLEFINSAGSWKSDGRQFVVGAVRKGVPELAIIDVSSGNIVREIPFPRLGEILNPTWSPDSHSVAFSAIVGGDTDLFVYNLDTNAERRLTSDPFADLQPAWSPDGTRLAFVTDRFSTKLENLSAGDYELALMDVESGKIEQIRTFDTGKSINPQWNADGRRLYFVSDRDGISNVYVVNTQSGALGQVTNVDGGISGITALSPAISAGIDAKSLALSAYENGNYHIYLVTAADTLAGKPLSTVNERLEAAGLPPAHREPTDLVRLLNDPNTGLPADSGTTEAYKARLSLDAVSQPSVSVGVSRFGPSVGGGLAFGWSDMLGNHNLYAEIAADTYGSGFSDLARSTGGTLSYWNMTHRMNWGLSIDQIPYVAGGYATGTGTVNGQTAFLDQTIIQRQVNRGVNALAAYPLSSANRIEFGAGFSQLSFDQQVRTVATSFNTGQVLQDSTQTTPLASTLNMHSVNAAFVNDTSLFGATSPVAGQRARIEVTPTMGSLNFTSGLVDYRKYFMPARFYTVAVRGLEYGRYGHDAEDPRLIPLFLGYPEFVRGYGINSFTAGECSATTGTCPTFDRLVGSKMAVGNVEFRFPLLRPFGVTGRMYGPVPVEVAFFGDTGVAWNRGDRLSFHDDTARRPVSSAGVTFRVAVLGFAVAQIDYAHPFDRPGRGWVWGFSLTPGF